MVAWCMRHSGACGLRLWQLLVIVRFIVTEECGLACGVARFRKLDGTPFWQFVPEADCPIHDK